MSSAIIQLLVLAGIAIFLILRLKNVLGPREGFEKPTAPLAGPDKSRASATDACTAAKASLNITNPSAREPARATSFRGGSLFHSHGSLHEATMNRTSPLLGAFASVQG